MSIESAIEQFCGYFREQVNSVDALGIDQNSRQDINIESFQIGFYKKVILITQIDTLAGIRYSKERYPQLYKRNHERFISFVKDHDIWPEGGLVSIPFLNEAVESGKISSGKLKQFIVGKCASMLDDDSFNIDFSDVDVNSHVLLRLCTTEQEEKVVRDNVHFELLYRYRNYLVHEARVPGGSMEVTNPDRPYYQRYINEPKLFLAYPIGFFRVVVNRAIDSIETYLKVNNLDPYDFVSETTRW